MGYIGALLLLLILHVVVKGVGLAALLYNKYYLTYLQLPYTTLTFVGAPGMPSTPGAKRLSS